MRDDQPLLVGCDGIIQGSRLLILIWGCEVVLWGTARGWPGSAVPALMRDFTSPHLSALQVHPSPHLVKLEGHANSRRHHTVKQVHVSKDPLIAWGGDAEVPLEQGV